MAADPFLVRLRRAATAATAREIQPLQRKAAPLLACTAATAATAQNNEVQTHRAAQRPRVDFRLRCSAPSAWATAIGAPGESVADLVADLRDRWPNVETG